MFGNDLFMWTLIVGFFTPPVVAVIQQPKFSDAAKAVVTFLFCMLTAGVTVWLEGRLTGQRFVTAALIILVTAITAFKGLWKPTGVAPAIERATTPSQAQ